MDLNNTNNYTSNFTNTVKEEFYHRSTVVDSFWELGIGISTICLLVQIFFYIVIPTSRKVDQKILTQMTIARLLNVIFEFMVVHVGFHNEGVKDAVYALYLQTDAALICWMFVFTKNLYDKVIVVFNIKPTFVLISVAVWILTLPIGLLCPFLLKLNYFAKFYFVYSIVKFIILTVNLVLFCRIFWIAIIRKTERNDTKGFLRTFLVALILVSITSLQVFLTDITSFGLDDYVDLAMVFCVINSYEAVAITALFIILVRGLSDQSLSETIKTRLRKMRQC